MKIYIVDDHTLFLDTLSAYIQSKGAHEVSVFNNIEDSFSRLSAGDIPDILLLDLNMPGMNNLSGLRRARELMGQKPVAIMSGAFERHDIDEAMNAGAAGFLPKTMGANSLVNAISFMSAGERYLPVGLYAAEEAKDAGPFDDSLSQREKDVLRLLCKAYPNKKIGSSLGIHEPTVKIHVQSICRKLGAKNRTDAAMIASRAGFK